MVESAETYDSYWLSGQHVTLEWTAAYFKESLGVLVGRKNVLDYGCGMGHNYQRQLVSSVENYTGADVSSVALTDAGKKGLATLRIQDNSTLEVPEASFDGAVCSEVFEHLWDPLAAATELHRVLRPGAVLVATVPNFGYFAHRLSALIGARVPLEPETKANIYRGVHIRFFNKKSLRNLLLDAGFTDVKVYGWDSCNIWHVFWGLGPLFKLESWCTKHFPKFSRLEFLANWLPNVFALRLRAVAVKGG